MLRTGEVFRRVVAGIMLVLLLAQLFHFERFPEVLTAIGVAPRLTIPLAIILVVAELLALPWLLAMRTGRWLTIMSMMSSIVAFGLLTIFELMAYGQQPAVVFGTMLDMPAGLWSLLLVAGLGMMLAFGMIDARRMYNNKKKGKR